MEEVPVEMFKVIAESLTMCNSLVGDYLDGNVNKNQAIIGISHQLGQLTVNYNNLLAVAGVNGFSVDDDESDKSKPIGFNIEGD